MFVRAPRNGDSDSVTMGIATNRTAAAAFVSDNTVGSEPRSPASWSLDSALFHQGLKDGGFVLLSRR
jgi:hypothetical protein